VRTIPNEVSTLTPARSGPSAATEVRRAYGPPNRLADAWKDALVLAQAALGAEALVWCQERDGVWRLGGVRGKLDLAGPIYEAALTRQELMFGAPDETAVVCVNTELCGSRWAQALWSAGMRSAMTVLTPPDTPRLAACLVAPEPGLFEPCEREVAARLVRLVAATAGSGGAHAPLAAEGASGVGPGEPSPARLQALGEMAAGMAHDFSNIVASVLGNVEMLSRRIEDDEQRELVGALESQVLDAADLVRRIREFAQPVAVRPPEIVDVNDCVRHVQRITRPIWETEAETRGARIVFATELGDVRSVVGSSAELREVLMNLVFNAIQALEDHGTILVRTSDEDGKVCIAVSDDGVGMRPEVRERVLDPFFTTKGASGTGLGLSVAYGLVARHGGSLEIESEEGRGTTMTVRLPEAAAHGGEPTERGTPQG
jgi:signal transduction histidine kinase